MDNQIPDCPFCLDNKILKGEIINRTANAYLIENTYHLGNFLIIPQAHVTNVQQLPPTWWEDVTDLLAAIPALSTDYNLSLNIGAVAGQTQPHLHFWVIPRVSNEVGAGKGLLGLIQLLKDK